MDLIRQIFHALTELHPLHPMIVHFPIGLTGAAAFFILLALFVRNPQLEIAAFANIALASLATLVAGITGILDNNATYEGQAPNAAAKIVLATALLLITAGTAYARWRRPDLFESRTSRPLYVAAYFLSFAIALVLGFLGGIILYGF